MKTLTFNDASSTCSTANSCTQCYRKDQIIFELNIENEKLRAVLKKPEERKFNQQSLAPISASSFALGYKTETSKPIPISKYRSPIPRIIPFHPGYRAYVDEEIMSLPPQNKSLLLQPSVPEHPTIIKSDSTLTSTFVEYKATLSDVRPKIDENLTLPNRLEFVSDHSERVTVDLPESMYVVPQFGKKVNHKSYTSVFAKKDSNTYVARKTREAKKAYLTSKWHRTIEAEFEKEDKSTAVRDLDWEKQDREEKKAEQSVVLSLVTGVIIN